MLASACRKLCKQCVTEEDIKVADLLLLQFCKRVHRLFGNEFTTPNMHMHCHLATCMKDFGPLQSFWLFSFERYNGILGNQPTNNRSIELQLIKRFVRDSIHLDLLNISMPLAEHFSDVTHQYAKQFQSTNESRLIEKQCPYNMPAKFNLTILDDHEKTLLKSVECLCFNLPFQYC